MIQLMDVQLISQDELREFLFRESSPIDEIQFLNVFFPDVAVDLASFDFFKAHFYIHHGLYLLKKELAKDGYLIHIQLAKVFLFEIPGKNFCSWFSEDSLSFCSQPVHLSSLSIQSPAERYCPRHREIHEKRAAEGALNFNGLQEFYLDLENIQGIDEERFREVTASGAFLADNIVKIHQSLELFSLPPGTSMERITRRYRYLAKQNHPDISGAGNTDSDPFRKLKDAYEILSKWKKGG